jgi:hypothetical protein
VHPPPPVLTVTVAEQEIDPSGPVAVPVYVVSTVGETDTLPATTGVEVPIVLSIKKVVASAVVHESTEDPPEFIAVGFAESVQAGVCGGGGGGVVVTVIVAVQVIEPPGPVAVPV